MNNLVLNREVDPEAFAKLDAHCFRPAWPCSSFQISPRHLGCGLWQEHVLMGFVYGQIILDEVELWRIAVAPNQQRLGLGTRLLEAFVALAEIRGAYHLHLEVAGKNHKARAFYHHHGFVETGVRAGYYRDGDDAHLLKKPVRQPAGEEKIFPAN